MKLEPRDYLAAIGVVMTVGSVLLKGGQITQQLEVTTEAVRQMTPVVSRLDAMTARLEAQAESNRTRINDLVRRAEMLEQRLLKDQK